MYNEYYKEKIKSDIYLEINTFELNKTINKIINRLYQYNIPENDIIKIKSEYFKLISNKYKLFNKTNFYIDEIFLFRYGPCEFLYYFYFNNNNTLDDKNNTILYSKSFKEINCIPKNDIINICKKFNLKYNKDYTYINYFSRNYISNFNELLFYFILEYKSSYFNYYYDYLVNIIEKIINKSKYIHYKYSTINSITKTINEIFIEDLDKIFIKEMNNE